MINRKWFYLASASLLLFSVPAWSAEAKSRIATCDLIVSNSKATPSHVVKKTSVKFTPNLSVQDEASITTLHEDKEILVSFASMPGGIVMLSIHDQELLNQPNMGVLAQSQVPSTSASAGLIYNRIDEKEKLDEDVKVISGIYLQLSCSMGASKKTL